MGLFSFREKNGAPTDEHASHAGASNSPPDSPTPSNAAITAARLAAETELQTSPRRRGRPPKNAALGGGNQPPVSQELANEIARQLEQCYDPKAWGALLAAPGDVMAVLSARPEKWKVSREERETLGATGSAFARTLMISNPRALAALMLASALFSVYVPRAADELKHRAELKRARDAGKTASTTTH